METSASSLEKSALHWVIDRQVIVEYMQGLQKEKCHIPCGYLQERLGSTLAKKESSGWEMLG
jgi:hypothetical protein